MAFPTDNEQNTWEENLPQALNEKHEQTMEYIKNSEVQEQYLQTNLQNLNQSDEDYSYKSAQIKTMIDDLVAMRLGLLTDLKTVYRSAQKDTSATRNNLANQLFDCGMSIDDIDQYAYFNSVTEEFNQMIGCDCDCFNDSAFDLKSFVFLIIES